MLVFSAFVWKGFWLNRCFSIREITLKSFCANSFRQQFPFSHRQLAIIAVIFHQRVQLRVILSFISYRFDLGYTSTFLPMIDYAVHFLTLISREQMKHRRVLRRKRNSRWEILLYNEKWFLCCNIPALFEGLTEMNVLSLLHCLLHSRFTFVIIRKLLENTWSLIVDHRIRWFLYSDSIH